MRFMSLNNMKKQHKVRKRNKNFERFNPAKLKKSIIHSGLKRIDALTILNEMNEEKEKLTSTSVIERRVGAAIRKRSKRCAANYNLKKSIFKLGPTGYAFEEFISEILKAKGYKTRVSVVKKGKFVKHEVDVVATRADKGLYCECKFHHSSHIKNDVKLPLYIHSRFLDIQEYKHCSEFQYAIFSNTKFSKDAITYANGVGIKVFSMNYPKDNSFLDIVKRYKLYPVTVLKSLNRLEKRVLLDFKVVTIRQITYKKMKELNFDEKTILSCLGEIKKILSVP